MPLPAPGTPPPALSAAPTAVVLPLSPGSAAVSASWVRR